MRTATGDLDLFRVYLDEVGLSQAYEAGLDAQLKDTAQAVTSLDAPVGDDGATLGFSRERARLEDLHVH